MACRTCKFYHVQPDADGRIRMRKHSVSPCLAPVASIAHLLPASITSSYWFKAPTEKDRKFMSPDNGEGCSVHERRVLT